MPPVVVGRTLEAPQGCEGLGGEADAQPLLGVPLREWRAGQFRRAGLVAEGPDGAEAVLAEPGVAFSAAAVRAVLTLGRARGGDVRAVPAAVGAEPMIGVLPPGPGLVYLAPGGGADLVQRALAAPIAPFDAQERAFEGVPLPGGALRVADAWVLPVRHWLQLLWANLLALGPHLWSELVGHGPAAVARLGWAALRAGSTRPEAMGAVLTRRGQGARIHRAATVEGAWLGDGVVIGAGAVVRGAVLGDGAAVEEQAVVEGAVLGRGARVQRLAMAKYSVLGEGAALGGIMQLGVLGAGAVVKHGATLMDMAFGQGVRVRAGGALVDAPHGLAGVCVGEGAVLASGVRVAPGRVIPPGLLVLPDPADVLRVVDVPAGCTRAVVRDGALEPLA